MKVHYPYSRATDGSTPMPAERFLAHVIMSVSR